jgi:hypothetical protein
VRSLEKSFEQLEEELLNGQRLQGVITSGEKCPSEMRNSSSEVKGKSPAPVGVSLPA